MIQRWDDLTPEEQQRYTDNEQLRALLAERTTALEQLQMALHVKHAQLTTITAERDNYRSKFRDLEHELQLERGQIVAMQQRAEAAEAMIEEIRRHVPVRDFAEAQYRAQWRVVAKDAKQQQEG